MGLDYYGVLQIQRTSTDYEIKKAYRNLALEFNAERCKQENAYQIFKLIGEAYDVLSDPWKKTIFDQYGEEGLKNGLIDTDGNFIPGYHYHDDPTQTYRNFFGTSSPYADLLNTLKPASVSQLSELSGGIKKAKQPPLRHPLYLTLHEVFFGGIKKMKIQRLTFIDEKHTKTDVREKLLTVPIKPGIRRGMEIVFPEEGDQGPAHIPADIIFVIEDKPHEIFVRDNDNLILTTQVSLEEALTGTVVTVSTIDHRIIRIPITDIISPSYEKIILYEGMPILEKYPEKGNLIMKFDIIYPVYLPRSSKVIIKQGFDLARMSNDQDQSESIDKLVSLDNTSSEHIEE